MTVIPSLSPPVAPARVALVRRFVQRHTLALYFVLAFVLSWWPWPLTLLNPRSAAIVPYGPLFAALLVVGLAEGRQGLATLLGRLRRWRVGAGWYGVAVLLPLGLTLGAVGLVIGFGAPTPPVAALAEWYTVLVTFPIMLLLNGPLVEEVGWRGVVLPRWQAHRSALGAALLLGLVWATWHLPLLVSDPTGQRPPGPFILTVVAQSVVLAWVYNGTRGSLLLPVLLHTAVNSLAAFCFPLFVGAAYGPLWWAYALLWVGTAGLVVRRTGTRLGQPPEA